MSNPINHWLVATGTFIVAMTATSLANAGTAAAPAPATSASAPKVSTAGRVIQKPIVPADKAAKTPTVTAPAQK